MTLTQLEYFLALAEHRSFSLAAKACGVTQPTLSAQFQKLEEELGHALVDRKSQPLSLTPMGQSLLRQAAQTVQSAETLKSMVEQFEHPLHGTLRLGVVAPLGSLHGAFWHAQIQAACPNVEIRWVEADPAELQRALQQAELDALLTQSEGWNGQGQLTPLFEESWWALAPSVDSVRPALSDAKAWLMGSAALATTRYASIHGWREGETSRFVSESVLGRAHMASQLMKWVLLAESELDMLPQEIRKRAHRMPNENRTLLWVQGMHAKNWEIQEKVRDILQEHLPSALVRAQ
jgi:DNA-binding transcriptional LysR family regulator